MSVSGLVRETRSAGPLPHFDDPPWTGGAARSAYSMLAVLVVANSCSLLDRSIMSLLIEPIKADFGLSNIQIGLLHGAAFVLFYSFLGIPLGRAADRFNRVRIISAAICIWSAMTALCGLAWNFTTLFLARIGVGAGEAALSPAAYSILTDSFPRRILSRAIGGFLMSNYLGVGLSYIVGGMLVTLFADTPPLSVPGVGTFAPWQMIFILVAAPGLLIALVMAMMPEPPRRNRGRSTPATNAPGFKAFTDFLRENARYLACHFLGFVGIVIFINGLVLWMPTFLHQTHGLSVGDAGVTYGVVITIFGGAGPPIGGWICDTLTKRGVPAAPVVAAAGLGLICVIPALLMPWATSPSLCYILIGLATLGATAQTCHSITALQIITPNEFRGQMSATFLLFVNICGYGLGPILVPFLADEVFKAPDLRLSLSVIGGSAFLLSFLILSLGIGAFRASEGRRAEAEGASVTS